MHNDIAGIAELDSVSADFLVIGGVLLVDYAMLLWFQRI